MIKRQNNHLCAALRSTIFTPDECTDIIKSALNSWTEEEGTILSGKILLGVMPHNSFHLNLYKNLFGSKK